MDDPLRNLVLEAERWFSSEPDFSDESSLAKASLEVLQYLDKFKIGPAVLSLLVVFAFPEKSREKMWRKIKGAIREGR